MIDHKIKVINFNILLNKYNELLPDKKMGIVKAFKYDKQMGREVFNYNGYARELQKEIDNNVCHCNDTKYKSFINEIYDHVLPGNLDIESNINLR